MAANLRERMRGLFLDVNKETSMAARSAVVAFRSAAPRDGRHRPDRPPNRPSEPHWGSIKSVPATEGPRRRSKGTKATQCGRLRGVGVCDFAGLFGHCFRPSSARGAVASWLYNDGTSSDVRRELVWVSLSVFSVKNLSSKIVRFFQPVCGLWTWCAENLVLWTLSAAASCLEVRARHYDSSFEAPGAIFLCQVRCQARWETRATRTANICFSGKRPPGTGLTKSHWRGMVNFLVNLTLHLQLWRSALWKTGTLILRIELWLIVMEISKEALV